MLARVRLAEIRSSVSAEEWRLLIAVAAGRACHEMAADLGVTAGSVRTRISRLRARLRPVACPDLAADHAASSPARLRRGPPGLEQRDRGLADGFRVVKPLGRPRRSLTALVGSWEAAILEAPGPGSCRQPGQARETAARA